MYPLLIVGRLPVLLLGVFLRVILVTLRGLITRLLQFKQDKLLINLVSCLSYLRLQVLNAFLNSSDGLICFSDLTLTLIDLVFKHSPFI